jgi:nicotinamidase/pyrazinamidase
MARLVFWDVDTQRDFMEPDGALYVPQAEALTPQLERLTRYARQRGITIVASMDDHEDSDSEISHSPDFRLTFPPHCLRGTAGREKIPPTQLYHPVVLENRSYERDELARLLPAQGAEIIITKQQFDVFSNPATPTLLSILRPDTVVVYGVALDVCVHQAILGLTGCVRRVLFVEDAARAIDPKAAERCMAHWLRLGVTFTTTREIVEGHLLEESLQE